MKGLWGRAGLSHFGSFVLNDVTNKLKSQRWGSHCWLLWGESTVMLTFLLIIFFWRIIEGFHSFKPLIISGNRNSSSHLPSSLSQS